LCAAGGAGARDDAEVGGAEGEAWDVEDRVVEQVIEFAAQVELKTFGDGEGFFDCRVGR